MLLPSSWSKEGFVLDCEFFPSDCSLESLSEPSSESSSESLPSDSLSSSASPESLFLSPSELDLELEPCRLSSLSSASSASLSSPESSPLSESLPLFGSTLDVFGAVPEPLLPPLSSPVSSWSDSPLGSFLFSLSCLSLLSLPESSAPSALSVELSLSLLPGCLSSFSVSFAASVLSLPSPLSLEVAEAPPAASSSSIVSAL